MGRFLIFFCLLISTTVALANSVTIGCATRCDSRLTNSLKKVATKFGIELSLLDMSLEFPNIYWEKYDGMILPGGEDIDPSYYLSSVEPELQEHTRSLDHLVNYTNSGKKRDRIEFGILKKYFADKKLREMPILGVCRGMQMLAVSQGIPLLVDIKTELGIPNRRGVMDRIEMVGGGPSYLNSLFSESFLGFKNHHQGIRRDYFFQYKERWPDIRMSAYSHEGKIVEAMEFINRPVWGIQFHPENDSGVVRDKILGWLLLKAQSKKTSSGDSIIFMPYLVH